MPLYGPLRSFSLTTLESYLIDAAEPLHFLLEGACQKVAEYFGFPGDNSKFHPSSILTAASRGTSYIREGVRDLGPKQNLATWFQPQPHQRMEYSHQRVS